MQPYASLTSIFITPWLVSVALEGGLVISSKSGTEPGVGADTALSCFGDFIMCFISKEPNKNPVTNVKTANTSSGAMTEAMRTSTSDSVKGKDHEGIAMPSTPCTPSYTV